MFRTIWTLKNETIHKAEISYLRGGREAIFITTLVFWILERKCISTFFLDLRRYLSKKLKMDSKSKILILINLECAFQCLHAAVKQYRYLQKVGICKLDTLGAACIEKYFLAEGVVWWHLRHQRLEMVLTLF